MTIAVLYGGASSEHDVSRVSGAAVYTHLHAIGAWDLIAVGIARDGVWYRQDGARVAAEATEGKPSVEERAGNEVMICPGRGLRTTTCETLAVDCIFPVLHGKNGEDGTVQGALDLAAIPYVGSTVIGSAVGMDKVTAKRVWENVDLPVVPYRVVGREEYAISPGTAADRAQELGYPLFIKPNAAGSSVGISRVATPEELKVAVETAFVHDDLVLMEEALMVREIETSVLGNDLPRTFPPGEVVPKNHVFYDYEAKYVDPDGATLQIPARLPAETAQRVQEMCARAFQTCRCRGLARVDCFIDTESGDLFLNEINTMPGFTPISMYPKMAEAAGLSYGDLLKELIALAMDTRVATSG